MASILKMRKRAKEETPFMKNGRVLLEELISSCDGKCNPIRTFSAKELQKATNNYDSGQRIIEDCDYILYKGFLEDRPISVKKYTVSRVTSEFMGSPFTDVVVGSQMSVHKNVLKLIGCCLETEHPILVHEFVGSEILSRYIYHRTNEMKAPPLSWKCRIKIAVDIANALAYLHTALSRPVIHRDIRPANIILDENCVAKLTDFSLAISIPEGQSYVEDAVRGRTSYLAPEYLVSGYMTEKVDVFSFGMFLLQVLTGRRFLNTSCGDPISLPDHVHHCIEKRQLIEILHPAIVREGVDQQELQALVTVALSCISQEAENRPTMTDVARELKRIQQYVPPPCQLASTIHMLITDK